MSVDLFSGDIWRHGAGVVDMGVLGRLDQSADGVVGSCGLDGDHRTRDAADRADAKAR